MDSAPIFPDTYPLKLTAAPRRRMFTSARITAFRIYSLPFSTIPPPFFLKIQDKYIDFRRRICYNQIKGFLSGIGRNQQNETMYSLEDYYGYSRTGKANSGF